MAAGDLHSIGDNYRIDSDGRATSTSIGLSAAAENSDVIAVTVAGPAAALQYKATIYDSSMLEGLATAWTMAETGTGAEVSTTAKPTLLFTTDADGAAVLSVTDVATASGATVYLEVCPVSSSSSRGGVAPSIIALTFD